MKKANIYFEGSLICSVEFKTIMYIDGRELRGENNELVAVVPHTHMIVIEQNDFVFEIKGSDLNNIINTTIDRSHSM